MQIGSMLHGSGIPLGRTRSWVHLGPPWQRGSALPFWKSMCTLAGHQNQGLSAWLIWVNYEEILHSQTGPWITWAAVEVKYNLNLSLLSIPLVISLAYTFHRSTSRNLLDTSKSPSQSCFLRNLTPNQEKIRKMA